MEKERRQRWQRYRFTSCQIIWFTQRKSKDKKYIFTQMFNIILYSKVQPDIEELTPNMEDNEDADSKKSEAPNLGKLEYSLDYDFQKQEV